jgi:hypothetical protein
MPKTLLIIVASLLLVLGVSISHLRGAAAPDASQSLYAQSAEQVLTREFHEPGLSFLLLDAGNGNILAARWVGSEKAISVGSLVKPFTALAYAGAHGFKFPEHVCQGGTSCWRPNGHGRLGIVRATALSCNSYYGVLANHVSAGDVTAVARQFGLAGPGAAASPDALIGKNGVWRESPLAMARGYAELLRRRTQPGVREIVDGMAMAVDKGTASGVSRAHSRQRALGKTGTAPCTHGQHAPGDGFALVAWPADVPKYVLMVRKHGAPGAEAAVVAGQMLRSLEP